MNRVGLVLAGCLVMFATAHCSSSDSAAPAGTAGSGGAAGTGGAAGAAGSGGTAGSSGAGGAAGTGGQTQAGYTSNSCGSIPVMGIQFPDVSSACTSCVDQSCCTEAKACGDAAECLALRKCYEACTDSACSDKCAVDHSAGTTVSSAFSTCREAKCSLSCDDFACVGKVQWNQPTATSYPIKLYIYELQSGAYLKGLTVKVCGSADATCASPLGEATTDDKGLVSVTVPSALEGLGAYFEISGTDVMPTISYLNFADNVKVFEDGTFYTAIVSKSTAGVLAGVLSVALDATRGHVLFQAKECSNYNFASASVSADLSDSGSTTTYIKGSLPSKTATATDVSGRGAILNLSPGKAVVTGKLEPAGTAFSTTSVLVRAGYMTTMNVAPTPGL